MAKRRTTQERIADLLAKARKLEAQDREQRKAAEAEKGRHLAALILRAGMQDEDQDVILGALIKTRNALANPSNGDRFRNELLGIARFGDPAALDNLIEAAIVKPHTNDPVATEIALVLDEFHQGTVEPQVQDRAPAGTVSAVEAARLTGWSTTTIVNAAKAGRIPHVRALGQTGTPSWRFNPSDLQRFQKSKGQRP